MTAHSPETEGFDLADDTWDRTDKVHDWRNHVPVEVKDVWAGLSCKEKALVAKVAKFAADKEEWD